jgi:glutamate-1-semialdehyde 2,1-aminomutase
MKSSNGYEVLQKRGSKFYSELDVVLQKYSQKKLNGKKINISQFGSLFWLHTGATQNLTNIDQLPKDQSQGFKTLFLDLLEKGIYLAPNAYEVGFLSLAHSESVLSEVVQTIAEL